MGNFDLILDIMGGATTIGRKINSPLDFVDLYNKNGVSVGVIRSIQTRTGFTNKELGRVLNISPSSFQRRYKSNDKLKKDEAERAYQLSEVIAKGLETFDNSMTDFVEWLHDSNTALGNKKPIDLMDSSIGRDLIMNVLINLQYGQYS
jgi:putative toxin-antitoxin system antitoxin component (TIGR02293 family)